MNRIAVLAAVVSMIENGYETETVGTILHDVANTFAPIAYDGKSLPKTEKDVYLFALSVKAAFPSANEGRPWPQLVDRSHMIPIIKTMRQISGCGLKEAKDILEANFSTFQRA